MANYSFLIEATINEIHERYSEIFGVVELAESLLINKSYLIRRFKKEVGITPGIYLQNIRINRAKELLRNPRYSLEVIAALCGFSCANYFCKVYKKETGETPTTFRKRIAGSAPLSILSMTTPEENELYAL